MSSFQNKFNLGLRSVSIKDYVIYFKIRHIN